MVDASESASMVRTRFTLPLVTGAAETKTARRAALTMKDLIITGISRTVGIEPKEISMEIER